MPIGERRSAWDRHRLSPANGPPTTSRRRVPGATRSASAGDRNGAHPDSTADSAERGRRARVGVEQRRRARRATRRPRRRRGLVDLEQPRAGLRAATGSSTVSRTLMVLRPPSDVSSRADPVERADERGEDAAAGCRSSSSGRRGTIGVETPSSPGIAEPGTRPGWGRSEPRATSVTEPVACSPSADTTWKLNWSTATSPETRRRAEPSAAQATVPCIGRAASDEAARRHRPPRRTRAQRGRRSAAPSAPTRDEDARGR